MSANSNRPERWKRDVALSIDLYNDWFMRFAPEAYRANRAGATELVLAALKQTAQLTQIDPPLLAALPAILPVLRMATAPPIARDRLIGLAGVSPALIRSMELLQRIPPKTGQEPLVADLQKICHVIRTLVDKDIFPWLAANSSPTEQEAYRAATVVADRLCNAATDPIIRNAQEQRQLALLKNWLESRGYVQTTGSTPLLSAMERGKFAFRMNVAVRQTGREKLVNIPIDVAIMPHQAPAGDLPLLIEAKSAGDFTNTNKRRKEEATKVNQLRHTYGDGIRFVLFLCGYFDSGYLGYEAAEGIDWVWEHRIDDLAELGV
jgi:hypothetical protein